MDRITVLAAEFDRRAERIEELTDGLARLEATNRRYRAALRRIWDEGGEHYLAWVAGDALGITDA